MPIFHHELTEGIAKTVRRDFWMTTKHRHAQRIHRDTDSFTAVDGPLIQGVGPVGSFPTIINMDPPDLNKRRRVMSHAFTPRAIGKLEEGIRFRPGADHPLPGQPFELVVGQPAQLGQHLGVVLAQRRRGAEQPLVGTVQPGEWWTRVHALAGARMVEALEEAAMAKLWILRHQRRRHDSSRRNPGTGKPFHDRLEILCGEPLRDRRVRSGREVSQGGALVLGVHTDRDPVVVALASIEVL